MDYKLLSENNVYFSICPTIVKLNLFSDPTFLIFIITNNIFLGDTNLKNIMDIISKEKKKSSEEAALNMVRKDLPENLNEPPQGTNLTARTTMQFETPDEHDPETIKNQLTFLDAIASLDLGYESQ